jgi:hypothetical protein
MNTVKYLLPLIFLLAFCSCKKDAIQNKDEDRNETSLGPFIKTVKLLEYQNGDFKQLEQLIPTYEGDMLVGLERIAPGDAAFFFNSLYTADVSELSIQVGDSATTGVIYQEKWTTRGRKLESIQTFFQGLFAIPTILITRFEYDSDDRFQKIYVDFFGGGKWLPVYELEEFEYQDNDLTSLSDYIYWEDDPAARYPNATYAIDYLPTVERVDVVNAFLYNNITLGLSTNLYQFGTTAAPNLSYFWRHPFYGMESKRLVKAVDKKVFEGEDELITVNYDRDSEGRIARMSYFINGNPYCAIEFEY